MKKNILIKIIWYKKIHYEVLINIFVNIYIIRFLGVMMKDKAKLSILQSIENYLTLYDFIVKRNSKQNCIQSMKRCWNFGS